MELSTRLPIDEVLIQATFQWFGSYLFWVPDKVFSKIDGELLLQCIGQGQGQGLQLEKEDERLLARTDPLSPYFCALKMVGHLRGRQRVLHADDLQRMRQQHSHEAATEAGRVQGLHRDRDEDQEQGVQGEDG